MFAAIDECSEPDDSPDADRCSENADCTDADPAEVERGYTCECKQGFNGDGISCNPGAWFSIQNLCLGGKTRTQFANWMKLQYIDQT